MLSTRPSMNKFVSNGARPPAPPSHHHMGHRMQGLHAVMPTERAHGSAPLGPWLTMDTLSAGPRAP